TCPSRGGGRGLSIPRNKTPRVFLHPPPKSEHLPLPPLHRAGRAALEVLAVTGFEGVEIGRAHRMVLSRCPTCFNSIRALILSVAQWTWLLDSVTQRAATDL